MKTLNFEILRDHAPDLADTGGFAERYVYTDPASSAVKLRILVEQMVLHIFDCLGIPLPNKLKLRDLIEEPAFQHVTPLAVRYKLDAIRIHGNAGAHGQNISEETSLWLMREAFQLVCWFFLTYLCREETPCPEYQTPPEVTPAMRQSRYLADEEAEALREPALDSLVLNESRSVDACYDLAQPIPREPQEPIADLASMLARDRLRAELGKKTREEVRDSGAKAASTLHLDDSVSSQ